MKLPVKLLTAVDVGVIPGIPARSRISLDITLRFNGMDSLNATIYSSDALRAMGERYAKGSLHIEGVTDGARAARGANIERKSIDYWQPQGHGGKISFDHNSELNAPGDAEGIWDEYKLTNLIHRTIEMNDLLPTAVGAMSAPDTMRLWRADEDLELALTRFEPRETERFIINSAGQIRTPETEFSREYMSAGRLYRAAKQLRIVEQ